MHNVLVKTTFQVKLLPPPKQHADLLETMRVFNEACAWIAERAHDEDVTGKFRIHKATYYEARQRFGMTAQLTVRAIGVSGSVKSPMNGILRCPLK